MPPKNRGEKQRDVQETETPLQAVVLADSFETRFKPFTDQKPRCLLELAGVPLIEYTLDALSSAGVDQVFVYGGAHIDQLEAYLKNSKWQGPGSSFELTVLRSKSLSIGDAMRDLDQRELFKEDFIVVYGDVISNVDLPAIIAEHKTRRAADKNAIMTMVLKQASPTHSATTAQSRSLFLLEPTTSRCLQYEHVSPSDGIHSVDIFQEWLTRHREVSVRHDLVDCGIDVMNPAALSLWSDNFDYEAPRRGFLHGVLKDFELNGKTIHVHIVKESYAVRASGLSNYNVIMSDLLGRWLVPTFHEPRRLNATDALIEDGVELDPSCRIGPRNIICRNARIGKRSRINNSIIGRGCRIGADCDIVNALLWDNVEVGDGSKISDAILGDDAVVGEASTLASGSLIAQHSKIAAGTVEHTSSAGDVEVWYKLGSARRASNISISTLGPSDDEDSDIDGMSDVTDKSGAPSALETEFVAVASASIYESLQTEVDPTTVQLELQGLRLKDNASEHQLRQAIVKGLVGFIGDERAAGRPIKNKFTANRMLVERTVFDKAAEQKVDQVDLLLLAQAELAAKTGGDDVLVNMCNELYMADVLDQQGIMQWWQDERSTASDALKSVRSKTEKMIEILDDDDEEDDDEEEEDDEDDDGDD